MDTGLEDATEVGQEVVAVAVVVDVVAMTGVGLVGLHPAEGEDASTVINRPSDIFAVDVAVVGLIKSECGEWTWEDKDGKGLVDLESLVKSESE